MKMMTWKNILFIAQVNLKYFPRLLVSPIIGAFRQVWETMDRMDAEIDAFEQNQRAERNPTRSFNA